MIFKMTFKDGNNYKNVLSTSDGDEVKLTDIIKTGY